MKDMQSIYILADDLTGAADAANYFRTKSRKVRVTFLPQSPWTFSLGPSVVQVFDSESRSIDVQEAKQRILEVMAELSSSARQDFRVFKKVDSTLRGHIGTEIEAMLQGLDRRVALLAPSFPTNGRTVYSGTLRVNGVPVSETAFAADPSNPITSDRVADLVRQTTELPVVELTHDVISQGTDAVLEFVNALPGSATIVVADSETDEDLSILAQAVFMNAAIIPCGSAGLAKQLAKVWCEESSSEAISGYSRPACSKVCVAVGSANPQAHEQLSCLTTSAHVPTIVLHPVRLTDASARAYEIARAEQELEAVSQRVIAVSLAQERAPRLGNTVSFEDDLAQLTNHWLVRGRLDESASIGFVATGGDTALALCKALSVEAIWPEGEVAPGMPWSRMETKSGEFLLVSKAGGFGDKNALLDAAQFLLNQA
jgi:uncharacterized protein YgbK (DUF1537 family)